MLGGELSLPIPNLFITDTTSVQSFTAPVYQTLVNFINVFSAPAFLQCTLFCPNHVGQWTSFFDNITLHLKQCSGDVNFLGYYVSRNALGEIVITSNNIEIEMTNTKQVRLVFVRTVADVHYVVNSFFLHQIYANQKTRVPSLLTISVPKTVLVKGHVLKEMFQLILTSTYGGFFIDTTYLYYANSSLLDLMNFLYYIKRLESNTYSQLVDPSMHIICLRQNIFNVKCLIPLNSNISVTNIPENNLKPSNTLYMLGWTPEIKKEPPLNFRVSTSRFSTAQDGKDWTTLYHEMGLSSRTLVFYMIRSVLMLLFLGSLLFSSTRGMLNIWLCLATYNLLYFWKNLGTVGRIFRERHRYFSIHNKGLPFFGTEKYTEKSGEKHNLFIRYIIIPKGYNFFLYTVFGNFLLWPIFNLLLSWAIFIIRKSTNIHSLQSRPKFHGVIKSEDEISTDDVQNLHTSFK